MRELSKKELLIWLESAEHERLIYMPKYTLEQERQAYYQIKKLIQNYPEVDKEFINSHAEIIFQNTPEWQLNVTIWAERIYQILKDARVNIKEE